MYCEESQRIEVICYRLVINIAYYRTGRNQDSTLKNDDTLMLCINSNFAESAILNWSHIFGALGNNQHHYRNHFDETLHEQFRNGLLQELQMTAQQYSSFWENNVHIRNNIIAHINSEANAVFPILDQLLNSAYFCHNFLLTHDSGCFNSNGPRFENLRVEYSNALQEGINFYNNLSLP